MKIYILTDLEGGGRGRWDQTGATRQDIRAVQPTEELRACVAGIRR